MKRSRKKSDNLVHYAVHKKDRQAWGAPTLCGKRRVTMTFDHKKVTCSRCMAHTNWSPAKVNQACQDPLIFCPECDRGQLLVSDKTLVDYGLRCTNCTHRERRSWTSLTI